MFIDCKNNNWIAVNTNLVRYLGIRSIGTSGKYSLLAHFDDKYDCIELAQADSQAEIETLKDSIVAEINAHERRTHA